MSQASFYGSSTRSVSLAEADVVRLRRVHPAMTTLRRGTPVVLEGSRGLAMMVTEPARAGGLAEFAALASGPATPLLAPVGAAAVPRHPAVLRLPGSLLDPDRLRRLADITAEQLLTAPAEPAAVPGQVAALMLVKLARLLPAAITAPISADPAETCWLTRL